MLIVEDDVRYAEWLRHHLDVLCPRASVSVLNLAEFERWCTSVSGRDCDLLLQGSDADVVRRDIAQQTYQHIVIRRYRGEI